MKVGIALDTTLDSNAGVQQYFKGLARYLISENHKVCFLAPPGDGNGEFKDITYNFGKRINPPGNTTSVSIGLNFKPIKIKKVLKKERFDLVHVGAPYSPYLGAKVIDYAECPSVITYLILTQSKFRQFGAKLMRMAQNRIYKKIDSFIAISKAAKQNAEIVYPAKYKMIPIGVNIHRYSPEIKPLERFQDDKQNILYINRLEKRKGPDFLIKAFAKVKRKFRNSRLIICSDGPLRLSLENLVEELNIEDVVFEGFIEEKIKNRYYASADICVFPSIYGECFGVVLIEAMASGKIPIAFNNEGYSSVLEDIPKLLVENRDIDELAKRIELFLTDKELKYKYEQVCLEKSQEYRWESVGKQIVEEYKSLVT